MANYNKVILIGNLTRDPQMSFMPSQTPVVEFGLAVNRRWKSKDGEAKEETCFIDCTGFGKQAETLNQYVKKGSPLLIEGRLRLDRWESQDGQKHSKHRVIIERFQFLAQAKDAVSQQAPQQGIAPPSQQSAPPPPPPQQAPVGERFDNDGIPF